jgi:hypothetical protein
MNGAGGSPVASQKGDAASATAAAYSSSPLQHFVQVAPELVAYKALWKDKTGFFTSLTSFLGDLSLSA